MLGSPTMRVALFGLVAAVAGCKYNQQESAPPDALGRVCKVTTTAICEAAENDMPSDFAWLQTNLFSTNCSGKDCHGAPEGGTPPSGGLSFAPGFTYQALLGKDPAAPGPAPLVPADYDPKFHLVEPGNPDASYLLYLMHGLTTDKEAQFSPPPDDVGFMPQNNNTLCCQKLDVVARWIAAGANP